MKSIFHPITVLLGLGTSAAIGATAYTGSPNSIFDAGNWDSGLPSLANQGTIASDSTWPTDNDMNGWDVVISSGTLTDQSTNFALNEIYGGSLFDIQGGTWTRNGVVRIHGGAAVSVSGGMASIGGIAAISADAGGGENGGFTLNVSAGDFVSNNVINFNNQANLSTINVSGGSATMGYGATDLRAIDESNTIFNVSGGVLDLYSLRITNTDTNIVVNLSGGSLIVGAGGYNPNSTDGITDTRNINFTSDSTGSWQLDGADSTTFEALYGDGTLLLNSGNTDPFASVFQVSGNTVSLIPEPSSTLLALFGTLLVFRRRR